MSSTINSMYAVIRFYFFSAIVCFAITLYAAFMDYLAILIMTPIVYSVLIPFMICFIVARQSQWEGFSLTILMGFVCCVGLIIFIISLMSGFVIIELIATIVSGEEPRANAISDVFALLNISYSGGGGFEGEDLIALSLLFLPTFITAILGNLAGVNWSNDDTYYYDGEEIDVEKIKKDVMRKVEKEIRKVKKNILKELKTETTTAKIENSNLAVDSNSNENFESVTVDEFGFEWTMVEGRWNYRRHGTSDEWQIQEN